MDLSRLALHVRYAHLNFSLGLVIVVVLLTHLFHPFHHPDSNNQLALRRML